MCVAAHAPCAPSRCAPAAHRSAAQSSPDRLAAQPACARPRCSNERDLVAPRPCSRSRATPRRAGSWCRCRSARGTRGGRVWLAGRAARRRTAQVSSRDGALCAPPRAAAAPQRAAHQHQLGSKVQTLVNTATCESQLRLHGQSDNHTSYNAAASAHLTTLQGALNNKQCSPSRTIGSQRVSPRPSLCTSNHGRSCSRFSALLFHSCKCSTAGPHGVCPPAHALTPATQQIQTLVTMLQSTKHFAKRHTCTRRWTTAPGSPWAPELQADCSGDSTASAPATQSRFSVASSASSTSRQPVPAAACSTERWDASLALTSTMCACRQSTSTTAARPAETARCSAVCPA
jgi:hypothetical protein